MACAVDLFKEALAQRSPDDEIELTYAELPRTALPDGIEEVIALLKTTS